ncbi:Tryptase beta-2, partial [Armadillidium vulgare]
KGGVTTGNIDSPTPTGHRGCFCLPGNQNCEPFGQVPVDATRITKTQTRIINTNPLSNCPQGQTECCYGAAPGGPDGPPPPVSQLTGCGSRRSLFPGRRASAEADFGEYPWMAAITGRGNAFVAAGVLVDPLWVLTVAHKNSKPGGKRHKNGRSLRARLGDYNLAERNEVPEFPHQEISVAEVIVHPQFNATNLLNDVALLRLSRPVKPDRHINIVCLPEPSQLFLGQRCFVSGWGENVERNFQPILKEVDLPIMENFECEESLRQTRLGNSFVLDRNSFLCAGGEEGKDACGGDGGAPLVCNENGVFTLVGLVAWGIGCGQNQVPGVYVNVATFSNFIKNHIHA